MRGRWMLAGLLLGLGACGGEGASQARAEAQPSPSPTAAGHPLPPTAAPERQAPAPTRAPLPPPPKENPWHQVAREVHREGEGFGAQLQAEPLPGGACTRLALRLNAGRASHLGRWVLETASSEPGSWKPATLQPPIPTAELHLAAGQRHELSAVWHHAADGVEGQQEVGVRLRLLDEDGHTRAAFEWRVDVGRAVDHRLLPVGHHTGADPEAVSVGDFDADGRPDLAVGLRTTRNVVVHLQAPDGSYGMRRQYVDVGTAAEHLWSGDVDGDGRLDLLTAGRWSTALLLLRGRGDGTFAPPRAFPTGGEVAQLSVADVDGDGRVDAVAYSRVQQRLSVLHGEAGGRFAAPVSTPAPADADWMGLADLTGDGRADLAFAATEQHTPNLLSILAGQREGGFLPLAQWDCEDLYGAGTGDVDGDGRLELIASCGALSSGVLNRLYALRVEAEGDVQARTLGMTPGSVIQRVDVADLDGDGRGDLLLRNWRGGGLGEGMLSGWRALADGTHALLFLHTVHSSKGLVVHDLDGDGQVDVASAGAGAVYSGGRLELLRGLGGGMLGEAESVPVGNAARDGDLVDLDADGALDLVLAQYTLTVQWGRGDGTFSEPVPVPGAPHVRELETEGRQEGGRPALVLLDDEGGLWRLEAPAGRALPAPVLLARVPGARRLRLADFEGDGRQDVVVDDDRASAPRVFLSEADGSLLPLDVSSSEGLWVVEASDVDGDGRADLVVRAEDIRILLSQGRAGFRPLEGFSDRASSLAVLDLTGDGVADLLTRDCRLRAGLGGGAFAQDVQLPEYECEGATAGDFDGDGQLDLAFLPTEREGAMSTLRGLGGGTFMPWPFWPLRVREYGRWVRVADVNGDGVDDALLSQSYAYESISQHGLTLALSGSCAACGWPSLSDSGPRCSP